MVAIVMRSVPLKVRLYCVTFVTLGCMYHVKKEIITSRSYLLRHNEQYRSVFVSPDMTKYQRNKHKQLVEVLKRRRKGTQFGILGWNYCQ